MDTRLQDSLKYLDATLQLLTCCCGFEVATRECRGREATSPNWCFDWGCRYTFIGLYPPPFKITIERGRFATVSKVELQDPKRGWVGLGLKKILLYQPAPAQVDTYGKLVLYFCLLVFLWIKVEVTKVLQICKLFANLGTLLKQPRTTSTFQPSRDKTIKPADKSQRSFGSVLFPREFLQRALGRSWATHAGYKVWVESERNFPTHSSPVV